MDCFIFCEELRMKQEKDGKSNINALKRFEMVPSLYDCQGR